MTATDAKIRRTRARHGWRFSSGEVCVGLAVAVVTLWTALFIAAWTYQTVLGGDFMVFYTFAAAARAGRWALQYDWAAFHAFQVALVPTSQSSWYPPAYPPLVPALYTPLAFLPFETAYAVWAATTMGIYAALMNVAAGTATVFPRPHVLLGSLLFPPFVVHELQGQSTIVPLVAFVGGWWCLTRARPYLAGGLLSLVAVKPHLGMALAALLPLLGLWRPIGGILLGLAAQMVLTLVICGTAAVTAYVATTLRVLDDPTLIEPDPRHGHALRMSLDLIASGRLATVVWLVASAGIIWLTLRAWRVHDDWTLRIATVLLATLLVSPHVQTYDAILLAPATLWLAGWAVASRQTSVLVAAIVLSLLFVTPAARISGVPLTVPIMLWLLWRCQRLPLSAPALATPR